MYSYTVLVQHEALRCC